MGTPNTSNSFWDRTEDFFGDLSKGRDPIASLRSGKSNSIWNTALGFMDPLSNFGGGGDNGMADMFNQINAGYDTSMKEIQAKIAAAEAQGRGDIADSLRKSLSMNQPYMQGGTTAMSAYLNSLGIGSEGAKGQQNLMSKFQQSPGYQYALQQSQLATQRKAAASGQGMSGAEQRELGSQDEGLANQDWSNWLGNYQNRLSDIAGIGQRSAMQQAGYEVQGGNWLANLGQNYTNMDVNAIQAAAKAKAEAAMAGMGMEAQQSNSWLGALGSLGGGAASWLSSLWGKK
jgi:hypothetical protein